MSDLSKVDVPMKGVLISVFVVVSITVLAYWCKWGLGFFERIEQWGQLGDFFGGVLNPIIGLASVVLISYTLRQNHAALAFTAEELQASREQLALSATALKSQEELMRQESYTLALSTLCTLYREELAKDRTKYKKTIDTLAFELRRAIVSPGAVPEDLVTRFRFYNRTNLRFFIPIMAKLKNIEDKKLKRQLSQLIVAYLSTEVISSVWFVCSRKDEEFVIYSDICKFCKTLLRSCHMGKLIGHVERQIKEAKSAQQEVVIEVSPDDFSIE